MKLRGSVVTAVVGLALCTCSGWAEQNSAAQGEPVVQQQPGLQPTIPARPGEVGFVPLTGKQRSDRFFKDYLLSPVTYVASAGAASGGQITNDPKEWGRTWEGYGKRVGTMFAMFTTQEAMHQGGDAILRYDPRYFRCRSAGFGPRTWNALMMSFLAYDSTGKRHIDWPQLVGAYGSGMLVTMWYPKRYDPLVQGVQMGHAQMGFVFGVNLVREYSQELKRLFRKF